MILTYNSRGNTDKDNCLDFDTRVTNTKIIDQITTLVSADKDNCLDYDSRVTLTRINAYNNTLVILSRK